MHLTSTVASVSVWNTMPTRVGTLAGLGTLEAETKLNTTSTQSKLTESILRLKESSMSLKETEGILFQVRRPRLPRLRRPLQRRRNCSPTPPRSWTRPRGLLLTPRPALRPSRQRSRKPGALSQVRRPRLPRPRRPLQRRRNCSPTPPRSWTRPRGALADTTASFAATTTALEETGSTLSSTAATLASTEATLTASQELQSNTAVELDSTKGALTHGDHDPGASVYCVQSFTHHTALAGWHIGDSDCVGGVLARPCSGADPRQPGIP